MIWVLGLIIAAINPSDNGLYTEKIEARVGSTIITSTDLRLAMVSIESQLNEPKSSKTLQSAALNSLIERTLIRQYLERVGMAVSDQEIERRINSIRVAQGAASLEDFRSMLESQGMSFESFKKQVREQMEINQFLSVIRRQTNSNIEEQELKAFFKNNPEKFSKNYEVTLKECVIPFQNRGPEQVQSEVEQYIESPSKFDKCVNDLSQSPSRLNGGSLGSFKRGMLREEVEQKVFAANQGEVVSVALPNAVQLIQVTKKEDLGSLSFESAKDEVERMLQDERIEKARDQVLSDLKAQTFIKIETSG